MLPLGLVPVSSTLGVVAPVDAVAVPAVALAAQMEGLAATIDNALDLPEIVHSRVRPPGIRPPRGTRATTLSSNASTRGDPGLGADDSGPYSLVVVVTIVCRDPARGQLTSGPGGSQRIRGLAG